MSLKDDLQKIVDEFESARCKSDQFVAEYAPGAIYAVRHGMIEVAENVETHSTSWGESYARFTIGIRVGGAIPSEIHKMIEERVKALIGEGYAMRYGTAWSFYGRKRINGES